MTNLGIFFLFLNEHMLKVPIIISTKQFKMYPQHIFLKRKIKKLTHINFATPHRTGAMDAAAHFFLHCLTSLP